MRSQTYFGASQLLTMTGAPSNADGDRALGVIEDAVLEVDGQGRVISVGPRAGRALARRRWQQRCRARGGRAPAAATSQSGRSPPRRGGLQRRRLRRRAALRLC